MYPQEAMEQTPARGKLSGLRVNENRRYYISIGGHYSVGRWIPKL